MHFIDTHIHLDAEEFREDLEAIVRRAAENEIRTLLIPNVDSSTAEGVVKTAGQFPGTCFPMMGLHPTSVKENFEEELKRIEEYLNNGHFIAIGEIGIDLYWDKTYFREQEIAFIRQMQLARELKLPAVIHSRKSLEEITVILKREKLQDIAAVFHCYPGSLEQARQLTAEGNFLGIGGVLTFKNAGLAEVVKNIPLEYLLLETDAPYLAPVPYRGKRNEPGYLKIIAEKIAEIKEISLETVAEVTTNNANRLFTSLAS